MKRAPHSLSFRNNDFSGAVFTGPDATLRVRSLFAGAYEVRYDFSAYPVEPAIESAAALLYVDDEGGGAHPFDVTRTDSAVSLASGTDEILVDEANGTVAVRHGGTTVHGGIIGSPDTVLPRFPIRTHGTMPRHVNATFNFRLEEKDRFYGLGDKTGSPNRRNRRFSMLNRDALGYREFADPLYKSIPFFVKWNPENDVWLGIAVSAPDVVSMDFGVESQYYYSVSLRNGPYRYVIFTGDSYAALLDSYTRLTGRPAFPPAFTFGFLGSSMDYVEPDDAPDRVRRYLDLVEEYGIPCEGLYLSSGYYKADNGHRYAFVWNERKFDDPSRFLEEVRARGYHVACNIKPGILVDHPEYDEFSRGGALVGDEAGRDYVEFYWGENAALWDFSRIEAQQLWRKLLRERLISRGIDGIWNDNNEYELEDSTIPVYSHKSTFALRMAELSFRELLEREPERRPWVTTRSGGMGIQRFARTWSGDNSSTWESMRVNIWMGASMGLTALPFFGHDIGGFFGDRPDEEQFLRWCQSAVFQPRFVIHSWNNDGVPTEVWSYESLRGALISLVRQHYEFLPYTYSCAFEAHRTGKPIQRLLSLEFPRDNRVADEEMTYMYGDAILAVPVVHQGMAAVPVYLPADTWWIDPENETLLRGGATVELEVRQERARYLARSGSGVFRAPGAHSAERGWFDGLVLDLYPPVGDEPVVGATLFEDDGSSRLELGCYRSVSVTFRRDGGDVIADIFRRDNNDWAPAGQRVTVLLPPGFAFDDGSRRLVLELGDAFSSVSLQISGAYDDNRRP